MTKKVKLKQEIKKITTRLIKKYRPEKIILFGSIARGEEAANADIDLLFIKESHQKRPLRVKEIFTALRGMKRDYPLDPIVYTNEELEKRKALGDYFIKRVLAEGKVIYSKKSFAYG